MRYFDVVGRCTSYVAGELKEIGFKNIESIERTPEGVNVVTKHDGNSQKTYKVTVQLVKEYIGPPKTETNDQS